MNWFYHQSIADLPTCRLADRPGNWLREKLEETLQGSGYVGVACDHPSLLSSHFSEGSGGRQKGRENIRFIISTHKTSEKRRQTDIPRLLNDPLKSCRYLVGSAIKSP